MVVTIEEAYRVLNLEVGASEDEVRRQYKKLALKTHPDKNPNDPEAHKKFLLISESYKRITEPDAFKDEEEYEPDEEELNMMFNMMFADMMGGGGFGGFGGFAHGGGGGGMDFFDILEAMMEQEEMYDDDDSDDEEGGYGYGMPAYMDDDYDDDYGGDANGFESILEAMLMQEMMRGGMGGQPQKRINKGPGAPKAKGKGPATKATSSKGKTSSKKQQEEDEWETEDDDEEEITNKKAKVASSKAKKGKKYDSDEEDQEFMSFMMGHMASELGLPPMSEKQMMQFFMANGGMGGEYDFESDDEDDEEEDMGGSSKAAKNKKKKNKKKKNKNKKANTASGENNVEVDAKPSGSAPASEKASPKLQPTSNGSKSAGSSSSTGKKTAASSSVGGEEDEVVHAPSSSSKADYPVKVGDRVLLQRKNKGTVAFVGEVHYAKGVYVGVIMDDPGLGKNNGTVRGQQYFDTKGKASGLMVSLSEVSKI